MAKFAVFLFALVAINAASARPDIKLFNQDFSYDVERFDMKHGNDLNQYLMQLRTISKEHTWEQLSMEIRELTRDLTTYLQDCYFNNVNVKQTLRQYLHHLEMLRNQHELDTVLVDNELIVLFDQMYKKLYDIIVPFTQTSKYERFVNTDLLKREFITELETICEEIYKYVQHFEIKYQGTERYWIIEKILKNYLFTIYQLKTDLYPITNQYYGEQVHETYGVRTENTLELFAEIKRVIFDLTKILREDVTLVRQDVHVYTVEIRKMIFLVDRMVQKLRMQVRDFEGDSMVLVQVIDTLDRTVMSLKRVIEYTTFTGMSQLMNELDQFFFTVVEQFHKLVMIDQEYRGRFDMDLTKVLEEFLMTLQKFKYLFRYGYEHESTYQYSGDYKYGKNYGYDYDYSYNMKPQTWDMEHKTYGYGKLYDFYYKPYETVNKKYDYELHTDMYKHEDKYTIQQLVEHIKIYSTKVVECFETMIRDTVSKDVLVYQVRDLITILDQIIYKLEDVVKTNKHDVLYQIYVNLKAIRSELYEIVHSDVTITVYQIRSQFILAIRKVADNLVKFVSISKHYLNDNTFVYEILYQYFGYIRNIHMKLERNIDNVDMVHYNKDFVTGTRGFTGKYFNY